VNGWCPPMEITPRVSRARHHKFGRPPSKIKVDCKSVGTNKRRWMTSGEALATERANPGFESGPDHRKRPLIPRAQKISNLQRAIIQMAMVPGTINGPRLPAKARSKIGYVRNHASLVTRTSEELEVRPWGQNSKEQTGMRAPPR